MAIGLWDIGHDQFECAYWYAAGREKYKIIKVSVISEREKRFSTVLQNKGIVDDSTLLKTNYYYSFKVKQEIFYRESWWIIRSVLENGSDVNPQALSWVKPEYNMTYFLEILKID